MTDWGAGTPEKWRVFDNVMVGENTYPLFFGEHPHSRSDNNMYVLMGKEPVGFDGHRNLINVSFTSKNYLKSSGLSGDEIRKSGSAIISSNHIQVYELFYRDIQHALREIDHLLNKLYEHPSNWLNREERENLIGRKIYYERTPAIISSLITEQGCVMIKPVSGIFPDPVYTLDDENSEIGYDEPRTEIKTTVLDPKIWWFRNKLVGGES